MSWGQRVGPRSSTDLCRFRAVLMYSLRHFKRRGKHEGWFQHLNYGAEAMVPLRREMA